MRKAAGYATADPAESAPQDDSPGFPDRRRAAFDVNMDDRVGGKRQGLRATIKLGHMSKSSKPEADAGLTQTDPTTPRRRPRQPRAEATVEALVEAAARLLEAEGLEAFNTNAVARKAGVSVGALYQYFPGKDAIMAALVQREGQAFAQALDVALRTARSQSLAGAVFSLADASVRHLAARPRLARLLDLETERLGLRAAGGGRERRASDVLAAFLAERRLGDHEAALDILHMSRGMIDAALERGATDGLSMRLTRAVLGYLSLSPSRVGQ